MKASLKMAACMAKVRTKGYILWLLDWWTLFYDSLGNWFGIDGVRYEGEYRDSKKHGQGKKEAIHFMIY